jgi:hypothetical protein
MRVNHAGSRPSQPATIGTRVLDLGEGEIGEAELAHQRGAARFDRSFFAEEVRLTHGDAQVTRVTITAVP